jgi:IclR family transcriptional regulator, KDG regulon repressor
LAPTEEDTRGDAGEERPEHLLGSVLKCLALIDALSECKEPVSLSVLARAVGVSRSTLYKRLCTLTAAGWVVKSPDDRYHLSLRAVGIGTRALEQASLGQRALPLIQELSSIARETVSIITLDRGESLIVQRVESGQVLRANLRVGTRMKIVGNASGEVLVAFAPPHRLEELKRDRVELPSSSILQQVQQRGASFASIVEGVTAIAVPILDRYGFTEAALSVAGPGPRFDPESIERPAKETAARIAAIMRGDLA